MAFRILLSYSRSWQHQLQSTVRLCRSIAWLKYHRETPFEAYIVDFVVWIMCAQSYSQWMISTLLPPLMWCPALLCCAYVHSLFVACCLLQLGNRLRRNCSTLEESRVTSEKLEVKNNSTISESVIVKTTTTIISNEETTNNSTAAVAESE